MASREQLIQDDIKRLHGMGYAQELYRAMGGFSNFAISFTIISILSGCLTSYLLGIDFAGPAAASIGWPIVSFFTLLVALSMAELASSFPTAGGLYYWSSKLGGPGWGWYTGWINLIGQVAVTTAIDYGGATFVNILMNTWWGTSQTPKAIMITFTVILALHAVMNMFGVRLVALLNDISVWWHIVVAAMFVIFLAVKAPSHSLSTAFHTGFTVSGFPYWYGFLLGFLLAQYTITGFDASAHMSEETIGAQTRAPWGIVMSVVVSAIAGWLLLLALTAAIPSVPFPKGSDAISVVAAAPGYNPVGLILNSALGVRLGTFLLALAVVAQFYCGMSSVTSNSRMIYAFSRDGALPFSGLWHSLNKSTRTPVAAIAIGAFLSWCLALPSLWSSTAYLAATSIAVIGLFLAYIIPVYLRWRIGSAFQRGPWHLGGWSPIINMVSMAWVAFICVLFMLPTAGPPPPINSSLFNYTPLVVLGVLALLTVWYMLSVRHWFKGPKIQGSADQLAQIEHDLGGGMELAPA
jgi:amino acid transporter